MIVAGVMSGTSADGINVALVQFSTPKTARAARTLLSAPSAQSRGVRAPSLAPTARFDLLAHEEFPYHRNVRRAILTAMNAESARVADLSRLNFLLGDLYADAIARSAHKHRVKLDLVGCHGQTLYHQGGAANYLGRKVAVTWQTGEPAIIAARLGVPVVSDFRPADMAAGGKGAPLVPFLDFLTYRNSHIHRIAQNIGGIANLTSIPADAGISDVMAFDTGPGNMLIDAATERLFGQRYDRSGEIAASGEVIDSLVTLLLRELFFRQKPPKTAGREEFGREYLARFLRLSQGSRKADIVATATALTARSIAEAVERFVLPRFVPETFARPKGKSRNLTSPVVTSRSTPAQLIVSGGGAKNRTLMAMLRAELTRLEISLHFSDQFGLPSAAKEAIAFALMAHETWHHRPSNVPSATGAKRPAILGKISYA
jgi:anhydro-N-acetylmuramic acid kinase